MPVYTDGNAETNADAICFFVLGGNFWEKIHAMFVRGACVDYSGDTTAPGA
jgi:hypothetical protein